MKVHVQVTDLLLVEYIVCESHVLTPRVNGFYSPLRRWFLSLDVG